MTADTERLDSIELAAAAHPRDDNLAFLLRLLHEREAEIAAAAQAARQAALDEAAEWHDAAVRSIRDDNAYWGGSSTWERSIIEAHEKAAKHFRSLMTPTGSDTGDER